MARSVSVLSLGLLALALVTIAGCNNGSSGLPELPATKPAEAAKSGEHGHQAGGHGGNIVEIGRDNYHAEAVFEKGGAVRLYLLGKDEARVQTVETQILTAYAKVAGGTEAVAFTLQPAPQADDPAGTTSQFLGTLPKEQVGRKVEVTVPSIRIDGARFRFGFTSAVAAHDADMPAAVEDEESRKLYLTPGGLYTPADIKANGNTTAAEKYKGVVSSHDMKPAAGDKICPVTSTKANPQFTWVVGGKTYEFCCPPCIDEFVQLAKEQPSQVKAPQEYVKKK